MATRRELLAYASAAALIGARARAQPLPVLSDTVPPRIGPGPLSSVGAPPSLGLSFMTPGSLDGRVTFARASTATYLDITSTMQTAASNTPRWDYDPVAHSLRGLLIEETRTNLVLNSTNMAGWSQASVTLTTSSGIAPDGTNSMIRLAEDNTTNIHYTSGTGYTVTASAMYTFSIFAKAVQDRYLQLFVDDGGANGAFATFDIQGGVISGALTARGTGTIGVATIVPYGNGIYRCSISNTIPLTLTRNGIVLSNVASPGFAPSYAGSAANGLLLWGVQFEAGAFPTSYVPTTGAAATRAADLVSMPTGAWFNTTNGTYQVECIPNGSAAAAPSFIGGNAGSPTIGTDSTYQQNSAIRGAIQVFQGTGPLFTFGAVNKAAFAYLSGANRAAVNGTAFGPNATTFSVTGTTVEFGSDGVTPGNNALDGWLRQVRYWPRVLSNTELQSVTH